MPQGILYLPTGVGFGYKYSFVEGRLSFFKQCIMLLILKKFEAETNLEIEVETKTYN